MPISISGGGGSGSGNAGLYKFLQAPKLNVANPDSSKFVQIWERNNPLKQRPETITILFWGPGVWMTRGTGTAGEDHPPDCGAAFGTVTLRGAQIPEKLYYWRGSHAPNYPYTYPKFRTAGFNKSPTRDGAWLLPNATGNKNFNRTDFIAPDAVGHHWGNWDAVYNGGNGHWFDRTQTDPWRTGSDAPGSAGSIFGPGKTTTSGKWPASCGSGGSDTARGSLADGIGEPSVLKPLGGLRVYAKEVAPATSDEDLKHFGGNGNFKFVIPSDIFGLAGGCPINPSAGLSLIDVGGGPIPRDRLSQVRDYYVTLIILFEFAQ